MTTKKIQLLFVILTPSILMAYKLPKENRRAPHIFVKIGAGGSNFSYTTVVPSAPLTCQTHNGSYCELSTTIPVSTLNSNYLNVFPSQQADTPANDDYVRYVGTANRIYK